MTTVSDNKYFTIRGLQQVDDATCRCGNKVEYIRCCGRYLNGGEIPQTAEQLMRSRYCGFTLCDEPYLLITWHPDTYPRRIRKSSRNWQFKQSTAVAFPSVILDFDDCPVC